MSGRRLARRAAHALLVTTLALSTAAGLAPAGAFAAAAVSSITASPSTIPAGQTLNVNGIVFGWAAKCEIVIEANPAPTSTCFVVQDTLIGTVTIPSSYEAGTYTIIACSPECPPPGTDGQRFLGTTPPVFAFTRVTVEPAVAQSSPPVVIPSAPVPPAPVPPARLVAVPNVVGMTLAGAVTALRGAGLIAERGKVPPNAHVSGQRPTAGTLVKVRTGVSLTFVSWVQVPDLSKLTLQQAVATAGTGLVVRSKTNKGRVESQVPVAGAVVPPATVIAVLLMYEPPNYVPLYIAGGVTLVVLIGGLAGARAFVRRRRRLARRWYYDHVRLASKPTFEVGFDDSGSLHLPSVHMAVRDTRLQTCELEEAAPR
jgi:hypothetical protein